MGPADWRSSIELAHLVDGYRVLEQLGELSPDNWITTRAAEPLDEVRRTDLGDLWTTMFVEHRRWRFASPFEPTGGELERLNALAAALYAGVEAELSAVPA